MIDIPTLDLTMHDWIGKQARAVDEVTAAAARRVAALLDREDADWSPGSLLPSHWYGMLFNETVRQSLISADGHGEKGDFLPPIPLPRRMFAGKRVSFHGPLRIGDRLTRLSTIKSISPKQGKSGSLCFVTVRHEISSDGRILIDEEQDIVYREAFRANTEPADRAARPTAPRESEGHVRVIVPDSVMLFRYSAITFNGHRIHYDRQYSTQTEGYPDIVVNGGLTLLLLWEHAVSKGIELQYSASKNLRPLFAGRNLELRLETGERTWAHAYDADGMMALEAELGVRTL